MFLFRWGHILSRSKTNSTPKYLDSLSLGVSRSLNIDFLGAGEIFMRGRCGGFVVVSARSSSMIIIHNTLAPPLKYFTHISFFVKIIRVLAHNVYYACTKFDTCLRITKSRFESLWLMNILLCIPFRSLLFDFFVTPLWKLRKYQVNSYSFAWRFTVREVMS